MAAQLTDDVRGLLEGANFGHVGNRYTGQPFPMRSGVVFLVEPEQVGFMQLPFADRPLGRERGQNPISKLS